MADASGRDRILQNPFHVLGLKPACSRQEMEREGQKLLGMLELGIAAASRYETPLGPAERTPEKVRQAMAVLRDPARRLEHEFWAGLDAGPVGSSDQAGAAPGDSPGMPGARRLLGWEGAGCIPE